jgi:hypothetical protein
MKTLSIFLSAALFSLPSFAEESAWIDCRSDDAKFIFQNGHLKVDGEEFQNYTGMEELFEVHSAFKKSAPKSFALGLLPSSVSGEEFKAKRQELIQEKGLNLTLSEFKKISADRHVSKMADGCRVVQDTTIFSVKAQISQISGKRSEQKALKCSKSTEERSGACGG